MLTYYHNAAQIRWAILKKLDTLPGVKIYDVVIVPRQTPKPKPRQDCIAVMIRAMLFDGLDVTSRFDLPPEFDLRHLHNEIDEIAEQYKAVFVDFWGRGRHGTDLWTMGGAPQKVMAGTGLRGRWPA
jgi:hypothetical protein